MSEPTRHSVLPSRDPGLRIIIAYKIVKGSVWLLLALILVVLLVTHETQPIESIGVHLRHHFTGAWSVKLARLLLSAAEPHHLWFVTVALTLDGSLTALEAWALHHGHWWGPWLVVAATSSFLPFEIVALVEHVHLGRLVAFVVNVAIVVYLVWRVRKERRKTSHTTS
jgi:uncharacterized membrane protein (DUF2068 family)